jgi:hypothetical protein
MILICVENFSKFVWLIPLREATTLASKRALPKGRHLRSPLLNLHPTRNSASREDESGNLQMMSTKKPRRQQHPLRE